MLLKSWRITITVIVLTTEGGLVKAVVYDGTRKVAVRSVPKPEIEVPTDIILKVTSAAICGSDLHMYEGRTDVEKEKVLGHEILGVIDEAGDGVHQFKKGDRIVLPFNISCGGCLNCVRGFPNMCYNTDLEGDAGAAYGFAGMGPFNGGQAEYVRVPYADFNAIKLPGKPGDKFEDDFLMLADILPTAYHANVLANVQVGHSVAIYGAGPVGLLSVMSARLRGAADIYIVDHYKDRLAKAKELGAIPINSDEGDPIEQIRKHRAYIKPMLRPGEDPVAQGVMSGIDAVGYQAHDLSNTENEDHAGVLRDLTELLMPTGSLGSIGVYLPADPGAKGKAKEGIYELPWGMMWYKGLKIGTGQCPVKNYGEQLRELVFSGHANPGTIVSHHIAIEEAPAMYERFDRRENGVIKAVIRF